MRFLRFYLRLLEGFFWGDFEVFEVFGGVARVFEIFKVFFMGMERVLWGLNL